MVLFFFKLRGYYLSLPKLEFPVPKPFEIHGQHIFLRVSLLLFEFSCLPHLCLLGHCNRRLSSLEQSSIYGLTRMVLAYTV